MSKWSSFKEQQILTENFRKFVEKGNKSINEKADPSKMDPKRFPMDLSTVAAHPEDAVLDTRFGHKNNDKNSEDDIIPVTANYTAPVSKLKPSQSSMNIGKAMGMALAMIAGEMNTGGDLGAFISKDGHIMDGHHRWVATAMVDPTKEIGGYLVDFPGKELIAVLNAITVGRLGIKKGKSGTGGFDQFQEPSIRKEIYKLVKQGSEYFKPEEVLAILQKFTGLEGKEAVEKAIQKFVENVGTLTFEVPAGAPSRKDMPVIDPDKTPGALETAVSALSKGSIDVNPPYADRPKHTTQDIQQGTSMKGAGRMKMRETLESIIRKVTKEEIKKQEGKVINEIWPFGREDKDPEMRAFAGRQRAEKGKPAKEGKSDEYYMGYNRAVRNMQKPGAPGTTFVVSKLKQSGPEHTQRAVKKPKSAFDEPLSLDHPEDRIARKQQRRIDRHTRKNNPHGHKDLTGLSTIGKAPPPDPNRMSDEELRRLYREEKKSETKRKE